MPDSEPPYRGQERPPAGRPQRRFLPPEVNADAGPGDGARGEAQQAPHSARTSVWAPDSRPVVSRVPATLLPLGEDGRPLARRAPEQFPPREDTLARRAPEQFRPREDNLAPRAPEPLRGLAHALTVRRWPLLAVLAIQAALSLRLVWSNTAFQDEGLYLWAGYLELSHLVSHSQIQHLATWFSGAPAIYPRAGAFAARFGGLAGARLLSLAFMLITTTLLHGITRRLWSSRMPAFFAAALFAWLGPAQFLGAFATFDPMALMLLAMATWLGVRAISCRVPARLALITAGAALLALANATKYMSVLFDPVVVAVAALALWRLRGWAAGLVGGVIMTFFTIVLLAGAYHLGGPSYAAGIRFSTLSRAIGANTPQYVLDASARWTGITALLAVIGALIIAWRWRDGATALLAWTLAVAGVLAPVEQAHLHTVVSLFKHAGFGAWFASAVAGYALAAFPRALATARQRQALWVSAATSVNVAAVALAGVLGVVVSTAQYRDWPNTRTAVSELRRLAKPGGEYLAEDYSAFTYELRSSVQLPQWWNTWSFGYTDPNSKKHLVNDAAYADAIRHRYFTAIILSFGDTTATDQAIEQDISRYGDYRLTAIIPYTVSAGSGAYKIWTPLPPKPVVHRRGHHHS